ncbi:hypothetical protein LTR37_011283 [Vermiconidia calcicola]|uniref:Uncharacterized protein n=1 Tax=Vermiconidia calcicola TaxID=1690605 RepID=A0ACC3N2L7_9PEZI|nr:hypothetical protein LTR37_011283 [Vermiconidia calcicola]
MSQARQDWETFKAWELKVCGKLKPDLSISELNAEIYDQWRRKSNQTELARSLRVLQKSLQDVEKSRGQVKSRRSVTASLRQLQDLEQHIERLLKDLRPCVVHIRNLAHEQDLDVAGDSSVDRSKEYTRDLLKQIRSEVTKTEIELIDCKKLLIERDAGSPARDAPGNDVAPREDGTNGQQQGRQTEAQAQGGQHSNGNGQHQQPTRQGGNIDPGGMGAGAPGGSEHSRRGNEPRQPASRSSDVVPDDDERDKSGNDPEEDDAPQLTGQRQTRSHSRPNSGRSQLPGAEDNGTEARRTPAESDILDALEAALPGNAVHAPHVSSSQKGMKSDRGKKTTTAPAGSHGSSSSSSGSDDGKPADRKRRSPSGSETRSSGSSGSHASKRQRPGEPNERGEQDDLAPSSSPAEPGPNDQPRTVSERLLALPGHIIDYAHGAFAEDTGLPDIDQNIVVNLVTRLRAAYGDDWEWDEAPLITEYLDPFGQHRPGGAFGNLLHREWTKSWQELFGHLQNDKDFYPLITDFKKLKKRLERIESLIPPPEWPPDEELHEYLDNYRRQVVVLEAPNVRAAWERHLNRSDRHVPSREKSLALQGVEYRLERREDPDWPPPPPSPLQRTADRPLPERVREDLPRVILEAQNIGFDNDQIPGNWTFLTTLGHGGFGHAGLWVKYDGSCRILDRNVVKETYLGSAGWDQEVHWSEPIDARKPREATIQSLLNPLPEAFNVVQLRDTRVYDDRKMYRLYMEYCEHGDLESLIRNHIELGSKEPRDQEGHYLRTAIPSAVLWCVFEALVSVACLLRDGCLPVEARDQAWPGEIFHRDIKPSNGNTSWYAFAKAPELTWFPQYSWQGPAHKSGAPYRCQR